MYNKGFIDYKKRLADEVAAVDDKTAHGVSMSEIEWFDFNVKSAVIGYRSRGVRLYKLLNRKLVKMADVYAEAMVFMAEIEAEGFTMSEYTAMLKYLSRKMNRLTWQPLGVRIKSYDKNGKFYISMSVGNKGTVEFPVDCKSEAQTWIINLVRCSTELVDVVPISKDFRKYLDGYLVGEVRKVIRHISPLACLDYGELNDRGEIPTCEKVGA